jgi:hypothetical protein
MRIKNALAPLAAALLGLPSVAGATELLKTDNASLELNGRMQVLGFGQRVDDPFRANGRVYLFLKQGRLGVSGRIDDFRYGVSAAFGGEDEIKATGGVTSGYSLGLLDMYGDVPLSFLPGSTYLRVGQFKAPYGRERLTDAGALMFAERSAQNLAFRVGRDLGLVLHTKAGPLVAGAGVVTGAGRNTPERYLPQRMGIPMVVFRAGFDGGVGEDVFAMPEGAAPMSAASRQKLSGEGVKTGFFVNALYTKDSQVGHSTVLQQKAVDIPLLLNKAWNPYLGQSLGELYQVGADAVVGAQVGPGYLSGELEANHGAYSNEQGRVAVTGGRVQVAYRYQPVEIALRYSAMLPSENFAYRWNAAATGQPANWQSMPITGAQAIQEVTPSLSYTFEKFPARLVADMPFNINAPVVVENGVGAYVLAEQPDQVSYAATKAGSYINRQLVINARLMLQAAF